MQSGGLHLRIIAHRPRPGKYALQLCAAVSRVHVGKLGVEGPHSCSTLTLLRLHSILTVMLVADALALLSELLLDCIKGEPRSKQGAGSANKTTG